MSDTKPLRVCHAGIFMRRCIVWCLTFAVLLTGCDIYSVSRSDQALGDYLGVDAWLDPALEPLSGCAGLNGEWSNNGNKVRDLTVDPSVFAAAFGIAEDFPDAVFADQVQLTHTTETGLAIVLLSAGRQAAAVQIPAADMNCSNPQVATVRHNGTQQLSVDASGALWVGEHRYARPGTSVCSEVGSWTYAAPNGMATIISGGRAALMDPAHPTKPIKVRQPLTGGRVPVAAIYLLPGEHVLPVRAWFQPESQWQLATPSADTNITASVVSCHVYAVLGFSESTDIATLSVVDLGDHFDWRNCHTRDNPYGRVSFDKQALTAAEDCFAYGGDWRVYRQEPPRVFSITPQLTLYRESDAKAEPQP